ncbi:Fc receptor-like protein 5 [Cololabis saira]|uniref:Fc receptor-like protein 5 n=1 Tax=Cololabis saira TaxID=129043 RepID=UPI002AD2A409|nr:Fc receptor-like protein 5 [Cololabis saira]
MFAYIFVIILGLCYCNTENSQLSLDRPRLYGPSEGLEKKAVDFRCELPNHPVNQSILYQLFRNDDREDVLGVYSSLGGEVATFPRMIKRVHEGDLVCVVSVQNNTEVNPTVSQTHSFKVIVPVKGAAIVHSGPTEINEGNKLELRCQLQDGTHVSYNWLLNGKLISPSPVHLVEDNRFMISGVTSEDSGSYRCMAVNIFNKTKVFTSNSSEVHINVKESVSEPDISFTVLKEGYQNYSAMVTCQSMRGAPPITFSLYNTMGLVSNVTTAERHANFKIPLIMDRLMGTFHCQANNSANTASSQHLPIKVVPVGGPVEMHYNYDMAENYAVIGLRFYCKAATGSHPHVKWYLNSTVLLRERGSFYYVFNQLPDQSVLLLSVRSDSAGTYHCEVSDSFDNSTAISSKRLYLDKEVLNRIPMFVQAVVFGCFAVMVLMVTSCCIIGVIYRRREYGEQSLLSLEMVKGVAAYEDDLSLSLYSEGNDELKIREDEFDQASDASLSEWHI